MAVAFAAVVLQGSPIIRRGVLYMQGPQRPIVFGMYFFFKFATLVVSAGAIYLGYRLFILGVTGRASLVINSPSVSGQLLNAAPGLFFAVGGIVALIVIVWKGVKVDTSSKEPDGPSDRDIMEYRM